MTARERFRPGFFKGLEVAIVGMGKSNQALTRYLLREGAEVTCFDQKEPSDLGPAYGEFSALGVRWSLGGDYLAPLPGFKWIFLTPGMKKNLPEIALARENGAVISSEIGLFLDRVKCRVFAVTGSSGKTTTCTLAGLMLREGLPGREIYVGGNIGSVLIEQVDSIPEDAVVVMELSSFQLELLDKSPCVSAVLNIRPNHLDIHETFEDYVEAKKNIFRFQDPGGWCFLNLDDGVAAGLAESCPGGTGFFTLDAAKAGRLLTEAGDLPLAWASGEGLYVSPGRLLGKGLSGEWRGRTPVQVAKREDFLVPGNHNVSNALAAALLAAAAGASPRGIRKAIQGFKGVEHRIEFVRELGGVSYYNDSIATSPDRTEALLDAIGGPLVIILGGYDKGLPFDSLARKIAARGCGVVTIGKAAPVIEEALARAEGESLERAGAGNTGEGSGAKPKMQVVRASSLDEAVTLATDMARRIPGSSVVLSPACASYDMFRNFEERGRAFKEAVRRLG